jgi:aminopeptidase N
MGFHLVLIAFLVAIPAFAQENKHLIDRLALDESFRQAFRPALHDLAGLTLTSQKPIKNDIQALSYRLWLDLSEVLNPDTTVIVPRNVEGSMTGTFILGQTPSSTFALHAHRTFIPTITSITVNGIPGDTNRTEGDLLTLRVPDGLLEGDTVVVEARYVVRRTAYDVGLNVIGGRGVAQVQALHPIAFTFAQPEGARRWFICNDVPSDKALYTIALTIPRGYTMAANGVQSSIVELPENKQRVEWSCPEHMPTYLVAFAVSVYRVFDQQVTLQDGRTIPIRNFHWDEDHRGPRFDAVNALRNIPAMFEPMEAVFGPYPYQTYGHMTVYPITFGGMEHTTMSTISRVWLEGNVEEGYAHELGHQWLGNLVTCATWGDIWLNEGGATYSEAIWRGARDGVAGFRSRMEERRQAYLRQGLQAPPVWDIPLSIMFTEATTYAKSAWIYHMVERNMGQQDFRRFMTWWTTEAGGSERAAQTQEFIDGVQRFSPSPVIPWNQFFSQWLVQRGHPMFAASVQAQPTSQGSTIQLTVTQTQQGNDVPDAFHVNLPIRCILNRAVVDTSVVITSRTSTFTLSLPFVPDEVLLDPEETILCEKSAAVVTSVATEGSPSTMSIESSAGTLWITLPNQSLGTLQVVDMLGSVAASYSTTNDVRSIPIDISHLPSGKYFVTFTSHSTTFSTSWLHLP